MGHTLTNQTQQTPLGFGPLGFTLEPGESRLVTDAEFAQLEAHPVIAGWIDEGKVLAAVWKDREPTPETVPAPVEPEAPPVLQAPEVVPPKVPTPTAKK